MKYLINLVLTLCAVCLLLVATIAGQQRLGRKSRKPRAPKTVCSVDAVPKGMVIVGHKDTNACANGRELLVKRPAESEKVCANSPVPDQYRVLSVQGALECDGAGPNPLTNAMLIEREKTVSEGGCPDGSVKVGVSAWLVRQCLGQPTTIDTKLRRGGKVEVWTYSVMDEPWIVVQIENGTAVAIDMNDTKRINEKTREYVYRLYQRANP